MAALELEGRISRKFARQSGQGAKGPWVKQEFILDFQDGNYTSQVCFTCMGNDKVAELDRFNPGDEVKVSFNVRGREFNGRWYNDVRVWRISPLRVQEDPGYGAQPMQAPAPSIDDMPAESDPGTDLPF